MRVLIRENGSEDFILYKIVQADISNVILLTNNKIYEVPFVLRFYEIGTEEEPDQIYIIPEDKFKGVDILKQLMMNGYVDLSRYMKSTFINPNKDDLNRIKRVVSRSSTLDSVIEEAR